MCIVAIAWQLYDKLPLVLLSNRDEFLDRPTEPAHQWTDMPIFAGRDKQSGGTWLGFHQTKDGEQNRRWAAVLNFRDGEPSKPEQVSRGQLVTDFLASELTPMQFAKQIKLTDYAGFNLIVGDAKQAVLVNNRGYPPTALHAGLHVISNGAPDDRWFKCERLRIRVTQEVLPLLQQNKHPASQQIINWQDTAFAVLADTLQAPSVDMLPDTGMPIELEQALSSVFIEHDRLPNYGTRTQSLLTLSANTGFNLSVIDKKYQAGF